MTSSVSPSVAALVRLIEQRPAQTNTAPIEVPGNDPDVAAVVGALARHEPPIALGRWELGLLSEAWARKVMGLAGGGPLATKYEHYRAIGQHNGEVHLVLGWGNAEEAHEVLEVDPEYSQIRSHGLLDLWLLDFDLD